MRSKDCWTKSALFADSPRTVDQIKFWTTGCFLKGRMFPIIPTESINPSVSALWSGSSVGLSFLMVTRSTQAAGNSITISQVEENRMLPILLPFQK